MMTKGIIFVSFLFVASSIDAAEFEPKNNLFDVGNGSWIHGSKSCKNDQNPPIQIVQTAPSSYILRQNKCVTFGAPFIYVLFGQKTALVVDTGANELASESPIFDTVKHLYEKEKKSSSPNLE